MDHLFTLNEYTPKIKCRGRAGVDPSLIFGIDSKLFIDKNDGAEKLTNHHDEIETMTIWKGDPSKATPLHQHNEHCNHSHQDHEASNITPGEPIDRSTLVAALASLKKDSTYRVKGFIRLKEGDAADATYILNWAFERFDLSPVQGDKPLLAEGIDLQFTMMGERGEVRRKAQLFADKLGANIN
jgi:G3E family GTPase